MDAMEKLFKEYERCFASLDFQNMAKLYADAFISAGPKGTIAETKQQFIEKAEQASAYYRQLGMTSARILTRYELSISDVYSMVTIHWGVTFHKQTEQKVEFDISYIVQKLKDPKIVMLITHQDEAEAIKRLEKTEMA
jgi:hypothetical protein